MSTLDVPNQDCNCAAEHNSLTFSFIHCLPSFIFPSFPRLLSLFDFVLLCIHLLLSSSSCFVSPQVPFHYFFPPSFFLSFRCLFHSIHQSSTILEIGRLLGVKCTERPCGFSFVFLLQTSLNISINLVCLSGQYCTFH
jgi:hypothetical protein